MIDPLPVQGTSGGEVGGGRIIFPTRQTVCVISAISFLEAMRLGGKGGEGWGGLGGSVCVCVLVVRQPLIDCHFLDEEEREEGQAEKGGGGSMT